MMRRTLLAVLLAVILLMGGAAWYLFRPEKAFTDDVVDEPFPGEVSPGTAPEPSSANPPDHVRSLGCSIVVSLSHVST
jgi:hypothetical protein